MPTRTVNLTSDEAALYDSGKPVTIAKHRAFLIATLHPRASYPSNRFLCPMGYSEATAFKAATLRHSRLARCESNEYVIIRVTDREDGTVSLFLGTMDSDGSNRKVKAL